MRGLDYLGTILEHKTKSKHDIEISKIILDSKNHLDWCVVCLFYFALHCINAHAKQNGVRTFKPRGGERTSFHKKRINYVALHLGGFFTIFNRLYDYSRQCRYDPTYFKHMTYDTVERLYEYALDKAQRMYIYSP